MRVAPKCVRSGAADGQLVEVEAQTQTRRPRNRISSRAWAYNPAILDRRETERQLVAQVGTVGQQVDIENSPHRLIGTPFEYIQTRADCRRLKIPCGWEQNKIRIWSGRASGRQWTLSRSSARVPSSGIESMMIDGSYQPRQRALQPGREVTGLLQARQIRRNRAASMTRNPCGVAGERGAWVILK